MRRATLIAVIVVLIALLVIISSVGIFWIDQKNTTSTSTVSDGKLRIVAAENFWGSLISQLGGNRVSVLSVVSDPNADPHEYEANTADARAIAEANLVVVNGAGYDVWATHLIDASNNPNRIVLNVQELVHQSDTANPHFWYSPYYVNDTVKSMYNALTTLDPSDLKYFHAQYSELNSSLWHSYMNEETMIKQEFNGTAVAATEDVFTYMANATGLKLVSPPGFMSAVAEGNDPSAQDVALFQQLMESGNGTVHVLVYNEQTISPLTQNIESLATQHGIPVVAITETIRPQNETFQTWMGSEVISLQNALSS